MHRGEDREVGQAGWEVWSCKTKVPKHEPLPGGLIYTDVWACTQSLWFSRFEEGSENLLFPTKSQVMMVIQL